MLLVAAHFIVRDIGLKSKNIAVSSHRDQMAFQYRRLYGSQLAIYKLKVSSTIPFNSIV